MYRKTMPSGKKTNRVSNRNRVATVRKQQCQYILANGRQCKRLAKTEAPCNGKWCWQHCRTKAFESFDFLKNGIRTVIRGYDVLVLPKGTTLWHGTSIKFPDKAIPRAPAYFSGPLEAQPYAFRFKGVRGGAEGKIVTFKTKRAITLIEMTERSLAMLAKMDGFDRKEFKNAFSYGKQKLYRYSYIPRDNKLTEWICKQNGLFDGWTWTKGGDEDGHHPEVVLCITKGNVTRSDIEYRFDPRYVDYLFKMKGSNLTAVYPRDSLGPIDQGDFTLFDEPRNKLQASDRAFIRAVFAEEAKTN